MPMYQYVQVVQQPVRQQQQLPLHQHTVQQQPANQPPPQPVSVPMSMPMPVPMPSHQPSPQQQYIMAPQHQDHSQQVQQTQQMHQPLQQPQIQQPHLQQQQQQQQQHQQPQQQIQQLQQIQQPPMQQQISYLPFQQSQQQIWVQPQQMPQQFSMHAISEKPLLAPPTIPSLAKAEEKSKALLKRKRGRREEEVFVPPEGLLYIPEFITEEEERMIINWVYDNDWDDNGGRMKRRVRQYGYRFMHENGSTLEKTNPVPEFLRFLFERMQNITGEGTFAIPRVDPNQILINEYLPGQGIKLHLDKKDLFDGIISSISLNSDCVMQLKKGGKVYNQVLHRRSYLCLTGPARNDWQHGIQGQTHDVINGVMRPRDTRLSITFRRVMPQKNLDI
eukprot:TRINITY_DN6642_c2_g1_i1.p1 TRINITY_DN6642_c2_g1~~TRINITY_DN6642_c2_g1_i1.p1  ORF type:complete len:449 (+),score=179.03 TRINITY_DN6642_c2_g1_i1:182-1348(+)